MQNHLNDTLYDTAEKVFENLAFVLTMPEDEGFGDFDFDAVDFGDGSCDAEPSCGGDHDAENDFVESDVEIEEFKSFEDDLDASEPGDETGEPSHEETIVTSVHFRGPFEGDLFLEVSSDLLPIVAMNMLGMDDENAASHDEQKDAFKELLNVICGNLLPAIAGERAVFNIDPVEIRSETSLPMTFHEKNPLASAHIGLEVGHAKLAFFADEKICETQQTATHGCA